MGIIESLDQFQFYGSQNCPAVFFSKYAEDYEIGRRLHPDIAGAVVKSAKKRWKCLPHGGWVLLDPILKVRMQGL